MPNPPLPDETRLRIAELADQGLSVRQTAKELGIAPSTVTRAARTMNLRFDRAATAAATRARQADAKARRVELADRALTEAAGELDRLRRPTRLYSFSWKDGEYLEHVVPQPPGAERVAIARVFAVLVDRHVKLAEVDMTDESTDHARSVLGRLMSDLEQLNDVDQWLSYIAPGTDEQSPAT